LMAAWIVARGVSCASTEALIQKHKMRVAILTSRLFSRNISFLFCFETIIASQTSWRCPRLEKLRLNQVWLCAFSLHHFQSRGSPLSLSNGVSRANLDPRIFTWQVPALSRPRPEEEKA